MKPLLLAPKPVADFTPAEYKNYISSLREKPKAPTAEITLRRNTKGTLIITTRRKPKYITRVELEKLALAEKLPIAEVWNYCKKKKFLILEEKPK